MQRMTEFELLRFLEEREDYLHRYINRKIPARLDRILSTEDILQDTWVSAFRSLPQFKATEPDAFERWLTSIANHRLIDAIRTARRVKRGSKQRLTSTRKGASSSFLSLFGIVASPQPTPSAEFATTEAVRAVRQALEQLPKDRQQAVGLRYIEGRSIADIADAMHKTKSAVHSLLFHGLRQLRERMGNAGRFFSDVASAPGESAPGKGAQ